MIIIIGDAPPNTVDEVNKKRDKTAKEQKNPNYWKTT
jgi:hypothetical protein